MTEGERPGPREARAHVCRWLKQHRHNRFWLATTLRRSAPTVSRWLGRSRPDDASRALLELLTGTPAEWWRTANEWKEIDRVRELVSKRSEPEKAAA